MGYITYINKEHLNMLTVTIDEEQADKIVISHLTNTVGVLIDIIELNNKNPNEDTDSYNQELMNEIQSINEVIEYFGGTKVKVPFI
jgi:hypothetical protein